MSGFAVAGVHGHRSACHPIDTVPSELHPALTGTRPWKRLASFAETRNHPTLRDTAAALALHVKTLERYIRRLENEIGHQLVHRRAYTALTPKGHALARVIAAQLHRHPELAPPTPAM